MDRNSKMRVANSHFLIVLSQKVPNKSQLINLLMDLLYIEKESAYRRLRGDVPFSFEEIALICKHLRISLDLLLRIEAEKERPFRLQMTDFEKPKDEDYAMWQDFLGHLAEFADKGYATSETWTSVPFPFCYNYPYLTRFYFLKWSFLIHNHSPLKRFDEIHLDERFHAIAREHSSLYQKASVSEYIVSSCIFRDLLDDIKFFHELHCISNEDFRLILIDMEACLDFMEQLAMHGKYTTTRKEINIYISDLNIDSNFTLIETATGDNHMSILRTLVLTAAINTDDSAFHFMKKSFHSLKRLSTYISMSGEKERVKYFNSERGRIQAMKLRLELFG